MNPAEELAELKLLKWGVDAAVREAEVRALEYAEQVRAKSLETDRGTVSVVQRRPTAKLDPDGFLAWVKANAPTEIVESVNPAYEAAFHKSLKLDGEDVLTPEGEVLDFAHVAPGARYVSAKLTADIKAQAEEYVAAHLDALKVREIA